MTQQTHGGAHIRTRNGRTELKIWNGPGPSDPESGWHTEDEWNALLDEATTSPDPVARFIRARMGARADG